MNRTENQEQSRAKKRGRGKRGNEIVARERTGDGGEKRGEGRSEGEDDLREKTRAENGEEGSERERARPVNERQTGFIKCIVGMLCLSMYICHCVNIKSQ